MPKRGCPFGVAAPLQLKVRVGLKELSRGVCGERHSREIFERTRQLLVQGAKAFMEREWEGGPPESCTLIHQPESPRPSPTGVPATACRQMLIGPGGCLLRGRTQAPGADLPETVSQACSSCVHSAEGKATCSQCERPLCGRCLRTCWGCGASTCTLCSTVDDSDVHERALCSSCAMFED